MEQVHLLVMVLHFVWTALSKYAETPEGMADLADIEAVVTAIENPGQQTGTSTSGGTGGSASGPQVIRRQ